MNRATHDQSTALETCAREALARRRGTSLTDQEWEDAKASMLALFNALRLTQPTTKERVTALAIPRRYGHVDADETANA